MQTFMRILLSKITWSANVPNYDYALFDCPPSFTLLSYSVLSVCDMILIPINPDFYAAKGVPLILNMLQMQIEPLPVPKIGVFMNKAKPYGGAMTKESRFYWDAVKDICAEVTTKTGINIRCFESPIYDRVKIKRAVTLWANIEPFINE
jgi:chromosome partitioning protein